MDNPHAWWQDRLYDDGESILRSPDLFVRALEQASAADIIMLVIALARHNRKDAQ